MYFNLSTTNNIYPDIYRAPVRDFLSVGALVSHGRDVLRHTKIVSKPTALVQAGHSAYSGKNTKRCFRNPMKCNLCTAGYLGHMQWIESVKK